jgi:hypothetical protein
MLGQDVSISTRFQHPKQGSLDQGAGREERDLTNLFKMRKIAATSNNVYHFLNSAAR